MRIVVLANENMVYVDGKGMMLDCSSLRSRQIDYIRWNENHGEIVFLGRNLRRIKSLDGLLPEGFALKGHAADQSGETAMAPTIGLLDMARQF